MSNKNGNKNKNPNKNKSHVVGGGDVPEAFRSSLPSEFTPEPELADQRWKNRIVGFDPAVDPNELLANPENWRIHPLQQQEVLTGVFDEVGLVGGLVVNRRTNHIVDGHLRAMLALRHGQKLPVQYVDLSLEEERVILATYDVVTSMAASDLQKVSDLVGGISNVQNKSVQGILAQMKSMAETSLKRMADLQQKRAATDTSVSADVADAATGSMILGLREDAIFPGHGLPLVYKGDFGIPALLPNMLARAEDIPSKVWDGVEKIENGRDFLFVYGACVHPPEGRGGTLAFYVEDQRFEVVWNDAVRMIAKLKAYGYSSVSSPDFSLWAGDPTAVHVYNIYRAAWCARYWQEAGIRVMPNLSQSHKDGYEIAVRHYPRGLEVAMLQCRTFSAKDSQANRDAFIENTKYQVDYLEPKNVVIYGGVDHTWLQTALPRGPIYHYLDSFMGARGRHGLLGKNKGVKPPKLSLREEAKPTPKKKKAEKVDAGAGAT